MSQPNETTGTDMVLTPRQAKLMAVRDDLAPGAKPQAIVPHTFVEVQQMCQALAGSSLVPKAFRGATGALDMAIVVMTGSELGIPPMAALRLFTTWDGVPRLMAEGIRALMLMSPDIEYFEMTTCDEKHATWIGKRRGRPEKSITWTMERAKRAELTSKENWRKYQESMLNARASMDLGRILAPDIIAGMRSLEEAQDGDFVETTAVERPTFVAPPLQIAQPQGPPPGVPAVDSPKRGPGRPPKDKPVEAAAVERPTSAIAPQDSPSSSGSISPAGDGSSSTEARGDSSPTLSGFDAAAAAARAADAARSAAQAIKAAGDAVDRAAVEANLRVDRFGQNIAAPTQPDSSTGPSPSTGSGGASTAANGAAPADEAFGEDPEDTKPDVVSSERLLSAAFAWIAGCTSKEQLAKEAPPWQAKFRAQSERDPEFRKGGRSDSAVAKAYAARKAELK